MSSLDFEVIVKKYWPMITRIVASFENNPQIAQELEQEVMLAVWQALPKFEGAALLKTYIARITQNVAIKHVAKEVRRIKGSVLNDDIKCSVPTPEDMAVQSDTQLKLLAAVRELPFNLKQVASLALEGFSNLEIAETLGISSNNVGVRLGRAKLALKEKMA